MDYSTVAQDLLVILKKHDRAISILKLLESRTEAMQSRMGSIRNCAVIQRRLVTHVGLTSVYKQYVADRWAQVQKIAASVVSEGDHEDSDDDDDNDDDDYSDDDYSDDHRDEDNDDEIVNASDNTHPSADDNTRNVNDEDANDDEEDSETANTADAYYTSDLVDCLLLYNRNN